ncbi:MAG: hypothetical protein IPJ68_03835 [Candidatus Moraniibacteriota bacterium]|nr:MAG: hypothetical protein IPJ68_03835 [Candidatus Moranbacteria bacterium]
MRVPYESQKYFRLHHCVADDHYHFITGPEDVSWPVWSREGMLRMVGLCRAELLVTLQPEDIPHAERELAVIRDEINRLARTQRRIRGKFTKDFLIPRNMLSGEREIAEHWGKFRRGDVPYMGYVSQEVIGTFFLPLFCDFVGRDQAPQRERVLSRQEWAKLAETPARIVTMAELGLAA